MSEYKIEKGIAVPIGHGGKWQTLARKMEYNDSVIVANMKEANALVWTIKRNNAKGTFRKLDGDNQGKYRVWKLEKK